MPSNIDVLVEPDDFSVIVDDEAGTFIQADYFSTDNLVDENGNLLVDENGNQLVAISQHSGENVYVVIVLPDDFDVIVEEDGL